MILLNNIHGIVFITGERNKEIYKIEITVKKLVIEYGVDIVGLTEVNKDWRGLSQYNKIWKATTN